MALFGKCLLFENGQTAKINPENKAKVCEANQQEVWVSTKNKLDVEERPQMRLVMMYDINVYAHICTRKSFCGFLTPTFTFSFPNINKYIYLLIRPQFHRRLGEKPSRKTMVRVSVIALAVDRCALKCLRRGRELGLSRHTRDASCSRRGTADNEPAAKSVKSQSMWFRGKLWLIGRFVPRGEAFPG